MAMTTPITDLTLTPTVAGAMREGARLRPQQCFHSLYRPQNGNTIAATCAIGAVYDALGILTMLDSFFRVPAHVAAFFNRCLAQDGLESCPQPDCTFYRSEHFGAWKWLDFIFHLNDQHHWTRERIADFIEPYEITYQRSLLECVKSILPAPVAIEPQSAIEPQQPETESVTEVDYALV